jgi:GAF domain-containing protein
MRAIAYTRQNVRAGEKPVGSLVVFNAVEVREATPDERKHLQAARKAQKIAAKQRRAARQAAKDAEKQAARDAATSQGTA